MLRFDMGGNDPVNCLQNIHLFLPAVKAGDWCGKRVVPAFDLALVLWFFVGTQAISGRYVWYLLHVRAAGRAG
ncbi:hypothetical protein GF1_21800 [Desulfolithobacter dissulfuricans]|uniref:Uncharacterized protein n=1 Tax=Desulfolithobacter dissulfuricans TaxID=2795293 RepID=A0A915U250_9BACT|nr:hypothetical protein GF1_21800 [Desulfolithobacter dissulfuricans]